MTRTAIIAGQPRRLDSWKPSGKRYGAAKPDVDLASLPMQMTLAVPRDYDQGRASSCGPNALGECGEFLTGRKLSRLFVYYWTRAVEGDPDQDGGVTIPDLIDVGSSMGMPLETTWPYDLAQLEAVPTMSALVEALQHRVTEQAVIADLDHLMYELATNRKPVLFGFQVPASMEDGNGDTARTGVVAVPSATDTSIGGHAVTAIGFDRARCMIQCTCHYGVGFGDRGTIWLPFAHWLAANVSDMRAVRSFS